jgi:hypothetical protein
MYHKQTCEHHIQPDDGHQIVTPRARSAGPGQLCNVGTTDSSPGERVPNDPSSSLLRTRIRIGMTELKCKLESRSILEKEAAKCISLPVTVQLDQVQLSFHSIDLSLVYFPSSILSSLTSLVNQSRLITLGNSLFLLIKDTSITYIKMRFSYDLD